MQAKSIKINGVVVWATNDGKLFTRDRLGRRRWIKQYEQQTSCPDNPYLYCSIGGKKEYVHRVVLGAWSGGFIPPYLEVDHINGWRFDCRVANLRFVSRVAQRANRHAWSNCAGPKASEWLCDGQEFKSWAALARRLELPYSNLIQWVEIYKDGIAERKYQGHEFTRKTTK